MKTLAFFLAIIPNILLNAQATRFFEPSKLIETGVYYYPEAWDKTQWDRDFAKMAEMGFEFTHFAEFAWARLEPTEGVYDFSWLDEAVNLAAKHKLKVVMCTPTACPPAWLVTKYPEVMLVTATGLRAEHGSREHTSWSSSKYRELCSRMVTQMAKHYANNTNIWGWQIDNEPSHYGTTDYNPEVTTRFRQWLENKYTNINNLNNAWGGAFWSLAYNNFSQIVPPNSNTQITGTASPHSVLDFKRFSADECAEFVSLQYNILRQNILPNQFITTNYMHSHFSVDAWRTPSLDFPSYTIYPVAGYSNGLGEQGFRMGDPWRVSFANDFFRPQKGVTGVMELQPGQVNWGYFNTQPYPGVVRAWLWNAFAGNLSFICSYRFRQPLFGSEQYHYGMVGTDGITPSVGGMQFSQFISEVKQLRSQYKPNAKNPTEYENRRTAILFNIDNLWNTQIQSQTANWNFESYLCSIYGGIKSLGAPVDFISENANFNKYKVMVAPAYQLLDTALVTKWQSYVENGGHLVLTARTGQKNRDGHLWEAKWADPITRLIGSNIAFYDVLPNNIQGNVSYNTNNYPWNIWADVLEPFTQTEVLATYTNQYYAGKAAVVTRKLGKGTVTYIGVASNNAQLERQIMQLVYQRANIKTWVLPEGVMAEYRNGFGIAINYNSMPQTITLPQNASIIIGQTTIQPADVLVWKEY